ncbi:histidine kinase, partial [Paenibacillus sepulcri]|nr:histidine kinase [Paenibacillus sepulcri]
MGNQRFQKRSEFFIRRLLILLILLLTLPLALAGCGDSRDSHKHAAEHGTLDLRNRSFLEEGAVALNGEWAFYPRQLLTPEQLASNAPGVHYVDVPKSWNSYPGDYGLKDGMGFATYRLTVRIDPTEQVLALRVPNIYSAYKLWINGELLTSEGTVGTSRQSSKAEQYPSVVAFKAETGQIDIVAQVSNFQHRKGGIWVEFRLGGSDSMLRMQKWSAAQDMVIFGSLLIIGIYHIGLYAFRRQEKFTIHFGLLCLIVALRAGVTGDSYLLQFFPISWETGVKLGYISLPLCAISGYLYVYRLFPQDASRKAIKAIMGIGFVLTFFVLIVPAIIYSKILLFYQLFALVVGLYCLVVLVIARMNRREGASFVLAGMGVFVLTVFNDVFFYNEWLVYAQLVPLGLFFFILMQSFIISTRFSSALRRVELVSNELRELNAHLEERIEERTDALKQTNQTLEEANRELGRMETSRRHLMTNISHDLRTPITLLQGYLEAIQDGVVSTEEQRQRYVRMMLGKVGG